MKFSFVVVLSLFVVLFSCVSEVEKQSSANLQTSGGLKHKFEELPGFFVELALQIPCSEEEGEDEEMCVDGHKRFAFCSASHVGGGYVVTAAHCVHRLLDGCSPYPQFGEVGMRVLVAGDTKEREPRWIPFSELQGALYHTGYLSTKKSDYDIALLRVDPKILFAGQAHLPQADEFSVKNLEGALWVYGIGLERSLLDVEADRQEFLREDYFGGLAYVDRIKEERTLSEEHMQLPKEQYLEQFFEQIAPIIKKGVVYVRDQEFKNILSQMMQNDEDPKKEDLKELRLRLQPLGSDEISPRYKALLSVLFAALSNTAHSYCEGVQGEGGNRFGEAFVTHNSSEESAEVLDVSSEDASEGLEKTEIESYLNYYSSFYPHKKKKDSKKQIISICMGDSGGPVLKKRVDVEDEFTLVAVSGSGMQREQHVQSVMEFLVAMGMSSCGGVNSIASSVNVHAHMDWIKAAQSFIEKGHYSLPEHLISKE